MSGLAVPGGTCASSSGEGRTWAVELPSGLPLLSLNGRDHCAVRNRKAQDLKGAAVVVTRQARVPRLERIAVTVLYDPPDRRRRDHDNLMATCKHLVDGIVQAGVVPDDSTGYVDPPRCEITQMLHPRGRLRMVITEVTGSAPARAAGVPEGVPVTENRGKLRAEGPAS